MHFSFCIINWASIEVSKEIQINREAHKNIIAEKEQKAKLSKLANISWCFGIKIIMTSIKQSHINLSILAIKLSCFQW